jgi:hypothetical protein
MTDNNNMRETTASQSSVAEIGETALNTGRELWRKGDGDGNGMSYYEPSVHVTEQGAIGINVGGQVYVMPVENWHALAAEHAAYRQALETLQILVDEQAEDEALWALYPVGQQPIAEAYLQQELRRLHAAVEALSGSSDLPPASTQTALPSPSSVSNSENEGVSR